MCHGHIDPRLLGADLKRDLADARAAEAATRREDAGFVPAFARGVAWLWRALPAFKRRAKA